MLEEEAECIATNVNNNTTNPSNVTDHPISNGPADKGVAVLNASAKWSPELVKDSLRNINFRVPEGKLCAVIGPVGSGKVRIKLFITYSNDSKDQHRMLYVTRVVSWTEEGEMDGGCNTQGKYEKLIYNFG
jgi:ABC-type protease/lipase transport system fused ATPase/permease subunit